MSRSIVVLASSPIVVLGFSSSVQPVCAALESGEFVWMPAGEHTISAGTPDGKGWQGKVIVDRSSFEAVNASFERCVADGYPPWIDINHADADAAGWIKAFSWDEARGIIAKVEWTKMGATALTEKLYRSFSPAFLLDKQAGKVTGIYERHAAGGLVNAPAFGAAMPALVAARLASAEQTANTVPAGSAGVSTQENTMNREQLIKALTDAGIAFDAAATDAELQALLAAGRVDCSAPAVVPAAAPTTASLQDAIVNINAILAKLTATPAVVAAPAVAPVVIPAVIPVQAASHVSVRENPIEAIKLLAREQNHQNAAAIFANVRPIFNDRNVNVGAILAANSLGSAAGTLVLQRSLDLLQIELPVLSGITTDYSAESAIYGQTLTTRLRSVPTVTDYSTSTGYADSDSTATDVSISLNAHKAVQVNFNIHEIAFTNRDIIGEQSEGISFALAKAFSDAIMALPTNAVHGTSYKTVKALASLSRADLVAMEKEMAKRGVSKSRQLWLNPDAYEKFSNDTTLVNLAVYNKPEMIAGSQLPPIAGFNVFRAVNLPATTFGAGALQGVAFAPDAFALMTRLPNDYTKAVGVDGGGSLQVVSHSSGISFQVVKFVDHKLGKSYWRAAFMYGVANGQAASAQVLTTA